MNFVKRVVPRAVGATETFLKSAFSDPVVVLNYHRVNVIPSCASNLTVSAGNFRDQMRVLREHFEPVRLDSLANPRTAFNGRKSKKKRVAVTFDDGYADTFIKALPSLEEFRVPATVFVTTGMLGKAAEFWWDEIEELLMELIPTERLCEVQALVGDPMGARFKVVSDTTDQRATLYAEVTPLLKFSEKEVIATVMEKLRSLAGTAPLARDTHRSMTVEELKALGKNPLIEIGAHTVNHMCLSILDRERQLQELRESKKFLEKHLGVDVRSVAYPFGSEGDFNEATFSVDRELGIAIGLTTCTGVVSPVDDLHALPRMFVKNWSGDVFERNL
ncbi:MAG: polysaccharide deacetylase family protein, partial [Deltaproteobacteria bacterium]|nr:polysaccharide deacetylase family protein [Deltaproteobacteria bacterium]